MTSVGYVRNLLPSAGRGADRKVFSNVKMIVFDEVDAIFSITTQLPDITNLVNHMKVGLGL